MRALILILLSAFALPAFAAIDTYEFTDDAARERFQELTAELRCPKCQNQNLADSNSPIAQDLRREVYRMVEAGDSDQTIVDFMVARYGEFVLYRPRLTGYTWILWYGPFVLLGLGVIVVLILGRRKKLSKAGAQAFDADNSAPNTTAATDHNARLGALLKSTDNSDRAGKQSDQPVNKETP
ncbi:cytochrome c-type biogenesis protein CcmH [Neptunomonas phycophila]|jgi:cytochrome c-type biogenesis protein CcmH|uniref:Cytochrome c-type biogenesis protein n=1 Tax=Neptunomonas phycophila TaxID=1572645 RepID=A0ABT9ESB2_9GAMM|nr:cytochrome c-type biogenesis protein [Neptunomonas phycophila]MDP2521849.1 cytochrome c-type biogenesis protein CcmH [Neptunomonas phycophila]